MALQPRYNTKLPVYLRREEIVRTIRNSQVTVLSGETGSGKTTQLPSLCLEAGCGTKGIIGVTQPRRIAATASANRVAEELGTPLGAEVGYKIRFKEETSEKTVVKVMTDGILLAEARSDPYLRRYDTIIVDEAHERSLNIDFVLGILRNAAPKRPDLKVIVTSATIDTKKFSAYFDDAPVIEVSGRLFPVEVRYRPPGDEEASTAQAVTEAVAEIIKEEPRGDILVFLPTEAHIHECRDKLSKEFRHCLILPLYGRLPASRQTEVFKESSQRRIVLATNVAETSLTIPGIRFVIDTGTARIPRYSTTSGTLSLAVSPISRGSADQRKGRCGRVENGVCIRLYDEASFERRPLFPTPEIARSNLADVILRMLSLRLPPPEEFPFPDPPAKGGVAEGYRTLLELGAIEKRRKRQRKGRKQSRYLLTDRGRFMASLSLDPRAARILLEARDEGCLKELLIVTAFLSIQDVRERPLDQAAAADRLHNRFSDPDFAKKFLPRNALPKPRKNKDGKKEVPPLSDFFAMIVLWRYAERLRREMSKSAFRNLCKKEFLSNRRLIEWRDTAHQLEEEVKEAGWSITSRLEEGFADALHRSVASGFLSHTAVRTEKVYYKGARNREVMLHPGSSLFNDPPEWLVAAEMVLTSRLYARFCAPISPKELERLAGSLCTRTHSNPRWFRKRGEVVAEEKVSLYGLTISVGTIVPYAPHNFDHAREIMIRDALVDGDIEESAVAGFSFLVHNNKLIEEALAFEDKLRRRAIVIGSEGLISFYNEKFAGSGVCDLGTLRTFIRKNGVEPLKITMEELLIENPGASVEELFPDIVEVAGERFSIDYNFSPGEVDDGVTIRIPVHKVRSLPSTALLSLTPGRYREIVESLFKGLPKDLRRKLAPVSDKIEAVVREVPADPNRKEPVTHLLSGAVSDLYNVIIPPDVWDVEAIPDYLRPIILLEDPSGREVSKGRDTALLHGGYAAVADADEKEEAKREWEVSEVTQWEWETLPENLPLKTGVLYPTLVPEASSEKGVGAVSLRLIDDPLESEHLHPAGVAELAALSGKRLFKDLKKKMILPGELRLEAQISGGAEEVQNMAFERLKMEIYGVPIRSKMEFEEWVTAQYPKIYPLGEEFHSLIVAIYTAVADIRKSIRVIKEKHKHVAALADRSWERAEELLHKNFFLSEEMTLLRRLPVYIDGEKLRLKRSVLDPGRDNKKMEELTAHLNRYHIESERTVPLSPTKKKALNEYRYALEEFRLSLFVPEIKPQIKVSSQRLNKRIEEIRLLP